MTELRKATQGSPVLTKENVQSTRRISFLSFILECKPHTGRDFCSVEISEIALKSWGSCAPDILGWGWVGMDLKVSGEGALPPTESCGRPRRQRSEPDPACSQQSELLPGGTLGLLSFPGFSVCSLCSCLGSFVRLGNTSTFQVGVSAWQIAAQDASPSPPLFASEEGHPWGVGRQRQSRHRRPESGVAPL